ncbi:trypsin-like serine protease [Conidiobolus coronatus NRRL 28638]|uniref:Trypsin-like serine protease n=1 Tax=Conidiobolus coronatus (strain ATCC 28846 / CBS 209.66 / NRRL 28638) TaxID=796925 RepID=A0A137NU31_CONC2|nr:trypsin-like serine protease [Conidiobolus coronatus NRRL 28638]|eukprot:KXN66303.1 trypsin-like serine protease [Conidiobolus coronatus NRRL 28638]
MVSLQQNGQHFCGGSLLDSSTILTAAHCTDEHPIDVLTVNVKRHDLSLNPTEEGGQSIKVTRQTRHPGYDDDTLLNDIAIWKLDSPITVPVSFVTLDDGSFANQVDMPAEAIGWGRIDPSNNKTPSRLQHTILPIYDNQQCSEGYGSEISPEAQVCAGYVEGVSSVCNGDSGGPLFVTQGNSAIQIGVASFVGSDECLVAEIPSVFARVAHYRSWIQEEQLKN